MVTVAIPYLFSACAQLAYLVSRRRPVQGWLLARDLSVGAAATLFSLWVAFAAGYSAVYQAMIVVLGGIVLYAFVRAHQERTGQVPVPADVTKELEGQSWRAGALLRAVAGADAGPARGPGVRA